MERCQSIIEPNKAGTPTILWRVVVHKYNYCKFEEPNICTSIVKISSAVQFVLVATAVVHDIGIKPSHEKYVNSSAKNQEKEGGVEAKEILERLDFPSEVIDRVVFLVEHHHTYVGVDGPDY
jgi:hypothetical protein